MCNLQCFNTQNIKKHFHRDSALLDSDVEEDEDDLLKCFQRVKSRQTSELQASKCIITTAGVCKIYCTFIFPPVFLGFWVSFFRNVNWTTDKNSSNPDTENQHTANFTVASGLSVFITSVLLSLHDNKSLLVSSGLTWTWSQPRCFQTTLWDEGWSFLPGSPAWPRVLLRSPAGTQTHTKFYCSHIWFGFHRWLIISCVIYSLCRSTHDFILIPGGSFTCTVCDGSGADTMTLTVKLCFLL